MYDCNIVGIVFVATITYRETGTAGTRLYRIYILKSLHNCCERSCNRDDVVNDTLKGSIS